MRKLAKSLLEQKPFSKQVVTCEFPKNKIIYKRVAGMRVPFIKPGYVYYLQIIFKDITLYKLGFTSLTIAKRIAWMDLPEGTKCRLLGSVQCRHAQEAYHLEQMLHRYFERWKYYGPRVMKSGNTELYVKKLF